MTTALVDGALVDPTDTKYVGVNPVDGEFIGISDDAKELIRLSQIAEEHYRFPFSRQNDAALEFSRLANQWLSERPISSFVQNLVLHPAYQRIIGMGEDILPLIFYELKKSPDHWFWALTAISGENPILPAQRGNLTEMRNAWLDWAKKNNYI